MFYFLGLITYLNVFIVLIVKSVGKLSSLMSMKMLTTSAFYAFNKAAAASKNPPVAQHMATSIPANGSTLTQLIDSIFNEYVT